MEDALPITPVYEDEPPLAPLSNLAHLSLVKNQRNGLRTELKAQQIARAEARASLAVLRRLAFRLAINISMKEKHIADTTRNLASSRKHDYVAFRKAEGNIEKLKESLKEEERRNKEILQTLEKATKLTLQCMSTYTSWMYDTNPCPRYQSAGAEKAPPSYSLDPAVIATYPPLEL
jgi:hypothetical protein